MFQTPTDTTMDSETIDEESSERVHPDYKFDDADLSIRSSDGRLFRVHSLIMRMVSSAFKDMLDVKRTVLRKDDASIVEGPVVLDENAAVLSTLFDMVYPGHAPPSTMTTAHFHAVAIAAEKYQISTLTKVFQQIILGEGVTTSLTSERTDEPDYRAIEEYGIALNLEWKDISDELSSRTLSCDLNSPLGLELLAPIQNSTDSSAVLKLHLLHKRRRIWLFNALCLLVDDTSGQIGTNKEHQKCSSSFEGVVSHRPTLLHATGTGCRHRQWIDVPAWLKLKLKVLSMLEGDCSGEQFLTDAFLDDSDLRDFVKMPCCSRYISENEGVLRKHFRLIVDHVPKTAEFRIPSPSPSLPSATIPRIPFGGRSRRRMQL